MKKKSNDIYILLPAILIFALLPMFMWGFTFYSTLSDYPWHPTEQTYMADYFLIGKMYVLLLCAAYMLIVLIYKAFKQRESLRFIKHFAPLFVYAVLCILSTIFAKDHKIAFNGTDEMFETIYVLLGYVIVTYYVAITVKTEDAAKILFNSFLVGTGVVFTIGTFQAFGLDPFETKLVRTILAASVDGLRAEDISVVNQGSTFSTLYNPNYNGVFVSMALPIFLVFFLLSKGIKQRLLYAFLTAVSIVFLYGSRSNAAFLVAGVIVVIVVFFLRKPIFKYWYVVIPMFAAFVCTFLLINSYRDGSFINEIKNSFKIQATEPSPLKHIETGDESVDVYYNDDVLKIYLFLSETGDLQGFTFTDDKDNLVEHTVNEENLTVTFLDERFPFKLKPVIYNGVQFPTDNGWDVRDAIAFTLTADSKKWNFTYDMNNETYYYVNEFGKCDKMFDSSSAIFTNYPNLFSKRGFIWAKTIPMLKDTIFIGAGPDNYAVAFPRNDYIDFSVFGEGFILTKPHCMYLQIATQTGVLSLLALLVFYAIYFIGSVKLYIKNDFKSFTSKLGVAILIATIGFMITGISNDSMIVTSPVFYGLLGLGVAVNHMEKENKKEISAN